MLTTTEFELFQKVLEERKEKIEQNLSATSKEIDAKKCNDLKDEGDHAAMSHETAVDNAILGQQSKELGEIELALDKIKNKTYGVCDMCNDEINIERLKVKPFARYCITCREVTEKE